MDAKEWADLIAVFFSSTFKFGIIGVPLAVFGAKYDFFMAVSVTTCGGVAGTVFYTYLFDGLIKGVKKIRKNKKEKKKFTFTNKLIVRVKKRFGLAGIAFLAPSLLSIPLGCFVAVRFYKNKSRIIQAMFISIFLWAVFLYLFLRYLKGYFEEMMK